MTRPTPRALLVDFYGTIVHSGSFRFHGSAALMASCLREDGLPVEDEAFERAYRRAVVPYLELMRGGTETHNTSWVADALGAMGIPAGAGDPPVVRAVRAYFEAYAACIEPLPGCDGALAELAERHTLVLVSNFTDAYPVRAALERFGWQRHFRATLISAELGIRKPHPEIFARALRAAGAAASEALFVGDDPEEDIAGAKAVGIPTVRVATPRPSPLRTLVPTLPDLPEPDYTVEAFPELVELVAAPA